MKSWFYPVNRNSFRFRDALADGNGTIDIRDSHGFSVGDRIHVYFPAPENLMKYELEVLETDVPFDVSTDKDKYWVDKDAFYNGLVRATYCRLTLIREYDDPSLTSQTLRAHGLRNTFSVDVLPEDVLALLENPAKDDSYGVDFPEDNDYYEGALMTVEVNKYERSRSAREKCIATKGCRCVVCGFDFEKEYGPIGKGFIHIHHLVPISSISKEYQLDVERDLVPVCPNCHYMLHRKPNGVYTIEELKAILSENS